MNTKLSSEEVEDLCFFCQDGGEVILCDFPQCPKVYHQACIMKIFPYPNTFEGYGNDVAYQIPFDIKNNE
jgi:hypothetical protein